jgi:hypothetical protein
MDRRFFGLEASYLIIKYLYGLNYALYDHPNITTGGRLGEDQWAGPWDVRVRRD